VIAGTKLAVLYADTAIEVVLSAFASRALIATFTHWLTRSAIDGQEKASNEELKRRILTAHC
jgi:hypothetical protein